MQNSSFSWSNSGIWGLICAHKQHIAARCQDWMDAHHQPLVQHPHACMLRAVVLWDTGASCLLLQSNGERLTISPVGAIGARMRPPLPLAHTCKGDSSQRQRL
jgi:hypothetical protein